MMLSAQGLYGHIRNNNLKSAGLLAGFLVQFTVFCYAIALIGVGIFTAIKGVPSGMDMWAALWLVAVRTARLLAQYWFVPPGLGIIWFVWAYAFYESIIRSATRAKDTERRHNKDLYNLVENLAITAGLPMPRIQIMETGALNAYAAGLSPDSAVVAVTRGLLRTLDKQELAAVIGHEMTHIKNRDVRLMMIASIFAGLFTLIGSWASRPWRRSSSDNIGEFGGGAAGVGADAIDIDGAEVAAVGVAAGTVAVIAGICMLGFVHISAMISSFAISRAREFMADGGAVELTKDPDALIRALQKISGHDAMPHVPDGMQAMMISRSFDGFFSTHPPVETRISALAQFAGGRITDPVPTRRNTGVIADNDASASAVGAPVGASGFGGAQISFGRRRPGLFAG